MAPPKETRRRTRRSVGRKAGAAKGRRARAEAPGTQPPELARIPDVAPADGRPVLSLVVVDAGDGLGEEAEREAGRAGAAVQASPVRSARELAAALEEGRCDLLLLDEKASRPRVLDALGIVRRGGFDVPVLVVTAAEPAPARELELLKAGASACLPRAGLQRLPALLERLRAEAAAREERRRERARREAEERLDAFMNHSPTIAFLKDEQGRYLYVSQPFRTRLRISPRHWRDKTDSDIFPAEVAERLREGEQEVLAQGKAVQRFESVPMPNGGVHTWMVSRFPVRDPSGRRLLGGMALDVSDLKRTEQALQATQERLERVLSSSPTVLYALAIEGESQGLTWVSRNIHDLLGYSVEEALEPGWWSAHLHPEDSSAISGQLSLLFEDGHLTHEYRFRHKEGGYRWIRDDARLRRDVFGRPVEVFGSWADITQRREAEDVLERANAELEKRVSERTAELRQANERLLFELTERRRAEEASRTSEERLQIVAQTTNDAIWDWHLATGRVWWNQGVQTLFGYGPDEVAGEIEWWRDRLHPQDRERVLQSLEGLLEDGRRAWSAEYRFRRGDGTYASVLDRGQVLRDAAGAPERIVGSMLDISEQKRAEAALHDANDKLTAWVMELEQRNQEMSVLGEMGGLLQTCASVEEAYDVVGHCAQQLFQSESGALYVFRSSRTLLEAAASWGVEPPEEVGLEAEECWALRRGRVHFVEEAGAGLRCPHVKRLASGGYGCIPMMAQGEALGLLHIVSLPTGRLAEPRRQFAQTVAENLALGLGNLRLREALRSQAIRDPLTGLFNRRFMEEALEREVRRAARRMSPLSLIMLDLDHFKQLNDTHGHEAGDALLRALGAFLHSRIRSADVACRYGGEEILLILPDASLDDARARAEDLREGVRQIRVQDRGRTVGPITVSAGVASLPMHGTTAEKLVRAADEALYAAKFAGRDRVMVAASA